MADPAEAAEAAEAKLAEFMADLDGDHDPRCMGDCGPCGGCGGIDTHVCLTCGGSGKCVGCSHRYFADKARAECELLHHQVAGLRQERDEAKRVAAEVTRWTPELVAERDGLRAQLAEAKKWHEAANEAARVLVSDRDTNEGEAIRTCSVAVCPAYPADDVLIDGEWHPYCHRHADELVGITSGRRAHRPAFSPTREDNTP